MSRHIWAVEGKEKGKPWRLDGFEDIRHWARELKRFLDREFPHVEHRIVKYIPERKYK